MQLLSSWLLALLASPANGHGVFCWGPHNPPALSYSYSPSYSYPSYGYGSYGSYGYGSYSYGSYSYGPLDHCNCDSDCYDYDKLHLCACPDAVDCCMDTLEYKKNKMCMEAVALGDGAPGDGDNCFCIRTWEDYGTWDCNKWSEKKCEKEGEMDDSIATYYCGRKYPSTASDAQSIMDMVNYNEFVYSYNMHFMEAEKELLDECSWLLADLRDECAASSYSYDGSYSYSHSYPYGGSYSYSHSYPYSYSDSDSYSYSYSYSYSDSYSYVCQDAWVFARTTLAIPDTSRDCAWATKNVELRCDKMGWSNGNLEDIYVKASHPAACCGCQPQKPKEFTCDDHNCADCLYRMTDGTVGCTEEKYGASQKKCENKPYNNDKWEATIWCRLL